MRTTARQMAAAADAQRYGEMAGMLLPFLIQQDSAAVEQLISRQALLSEAQRMGLRVTPEEVKDELQHGRYAPRFSRAATSSAKRNTRTCCSGPT